MGQQQQQQQQQQQNIKTVCHSTLNLDHRTGITITSVLSNKKAPLILERTELIIREASKRFLFETFLSRSFCPSFGQKGDFFSFFHQNKKKKDAKKIQYWFARLFTISILGDCLFVILSFHRTRTNPLSERRRSRFAQWEIGA